MLASNRAALRLFSGIAPALLQPPVNVLRLSLHPEGAAPMIANLAEWRAHIVSRLRRQIDLTADAALEELLAEIRAYPAEAGTIANDPYGGVIIPMRLSTPAGVLSFLSTTTVFGTPVDITLSELAVEAFFPADRATADALRAAAAAP